MGGTAEIDMTKLNEFIGKAVTDLGATFNAGLVVIGDKLVSTRRWRALDRSRPRSSFALANPDGPVFFPGAMQLAVATLKAEPRILERFKTGEGLGWHEHDPELFQGTERFFRPNYIGNLVNSWIPALEGVEQKLKLGAKVADVGCGHGASTILMATAFPKSQFVGFDYHPASTTWAIRSAPRHTCSAR
jgi:hypothetical protein